MMRYLSVEKDLRDSILLNQMIENPEFYFKKGLFHLRPLNDDNRKECRYDDKKKELYIEDMVIQDFYIDEYELEFDDINACLTHTYKVEGLGYIELTWHIESVIQPLNIELKPVDFYNPYYNINRSFNKE
jgi:hypothetical protein